MLKAKDSVTTVTQKLPSWSTRRRRAYGSSRAADAILDERAATLTATWGTRRVTKRVKAVTFSVPSMRGAKHFS